MIAIKVLSIFSPHVFSMLLLNFSTHFLLPIFYVNSLDMVVEKNLRGVLRSEVDRSVSRDSIIIVDSLNNIKVRPVLSLFSIVATCNHYFVLNSISNIG
jgi:hypothetical protein